jgi:hypothetical protein
MVTQKLVTAGQTPQGASLPAAPYDTSAYDDVVDGSIDTVRAEIDDAFADMKNFHNMEPDEIMRMTGGHSARLSELRVRIQRVEDWKREWRNIRTREIEPALEELERQYTIASRLHSIRELDYKMETGER